MEKLSAAIACTSPKRTSRLKKEQLEEKEEALRAVFRAGVCTERTMLVQDQYTGGAYSPRATICTPLGLACWTANQLAFDLLMAHGADPEAATHPVTQLTPLMVACCALGDDIQDRSRKFVDANLFMMHILLRRTARPQAQDARGNTAMHWACIQGLCARSPGCPLISVCSRWSAHHAQVM